MRTRKKRLLGPGLIQRCRAKKGEGAEKRNRIKGKGGKRT